MKLKTHPMQHAARLFTVFALLAAPLAAMPSEGDTANLKTVDQDVQALKKTRLIGLPELRATPELAEMVVLQRGNRLSITPVDPREWEIIVKLLG